MKSVDFLSQFVNLRSLKYFVEFSQSDLESIFSQLRDLNSLSLEIYNNFFELGNLNYFLNNINDWKNLKKLKFIGYFTENEAEFFLFLEQMIQNI